MSPAPKHSTIKAASVTVKKLRVLKKGYGLPSLNAVIDHLANIAQSHPELMPTPERDA